MAGVAPGIRLLQTLPSCSRNAAYKYFILFFTFACYTSYHLSRKPISVVKSVLHRNCTGSNRTDCSYPPFDGDNYAELLGSLDYAFLFAYAIGMFVCGHVAERMDLRIFLTIGMIMSGLLTMAFGLAKFWNIHSLVYFLAIQIVCGFFQATGWPSVVACVGNWFGKGKRGFIMGIWNSHTSVGNILGSVIAGVFVEDNWGLSFIVPGIIIVSMGILVFFFLIPEPTLVNCEKPDHDGPGYVDIIPQPLPETKPIAMDQTAPKTIQIPERERLVNNDEEAINLNRGEEKAISLFGAMKIPGVIEFSLCLFFAKLVSYTFLFWLPNYIKHTTPYNAEKAADLSTLFDVGGILGGITAGAVSDFTGGRASTCCVMLVLAAPAMYLYEHFGTVSLGLNIALLMLSGFLVNGPYALITTAVSADLGTHKSLRGNSKALATVTAVIDGTGSMGAALGPLLTGLISPTGWQNVFYMLIVADILALVFLIRLVTKEVRVKLGYEAQY